NPNFNPNAVIDIFDFSTANKQLIVFGDRTNDVLYFSSDEASTFMTLSVPFNISDIAFYPNSTILYVLDRNTHKLWRGHFGGKFTALLNNVYYYRAGTTADEIKQHIIYFIEFDSTTSTSRLYSISLDANDESNKMEYDPNLSDFIPTS
ncbi:hypothetical protein, partial [Salmonella sp. s51228]|uniref:hypothetical protein n=1 Tax=Salmonella sp. s51228 TaxID=3159652 RepID=UPI003980EFA8